MCYSQALTAVHFYTSKQPQNNTMTKFIMLFLEKFTLLSLSFISALFVVSVLARIWENIKSRK